MATGFTVLFPTDFAAHYRPSDCTVVAQPWFINYFWADHAPEERSLLQDMLATLAPSTSYYGPLRTDLERIQTPSDTRVGRRMQRQAKASSGQHEDEDADEIEDLEFEAEEEKQTIEGDEIKVGETYGDQGDGSGDENSAGELQQALPPPPPPAQQPQDQPSGCCVCSKASITGQMMWCESGSHINDGLMHLSCSGLQQMPISKCFYFRNLLCTAD